MAVIYKSTCWAPRHEELFCVITLVSFHFLFKGIVILGKLVAHTGTVMKQGLGLQDSKSEGCNEQKMFKVYGRNCKATLESIPSLAEASMPP